VLSLPRPEASLSLVPPLKNAYGSLSLRFPGFNQVTVIMVPRFHRSYFCVIQSSRLQPITIIGLYRSHMRYDHHLEYGVLPSRATLKSEAVSNPVVFHTTV
jgi:hypothetical protein